MISLFIHATFLDANDAMEYLNLSWNQLRRRATQEIAAGLRVTENSPQIMYIIIKDSGS